jgi:hypothetical protein
MSYKAGGFQAGAPDQTGESACRHRALGTKGRFMSIDAAGRRFAFSTVTRAGFLSASLLLTMVLAACTTVEGTNALVDPGTFEREVMSETLRGVGMIDREKKPELAERRAPLVLPKQTASLPAPAQSKAGLLPVDSDRVQLDTSNLSEDDLARLRKARVVDLRSMSGRPLTETEAKALTARMKAGRIDQLGQTKRPIYLPPEEYFTTIGGTDLVCAAASGELVAIDDKRCPEEIRKAIRQNPGKGPEAIFSDPSKL